VQAERSAAHASKAEWRTIAQKSTELRFAQKIVQMAERVSVTPHCCTSCFSFQIAGTYGLGYQPMATAQPAGTLCRDCRGFAKRDFAIG
jgi:hypothetical protein